MITIILNGEAKTFPPETTIASLVDQLALDGKKIAVERNLAIVSKSCYMQTRLEDGDRVEIIHFVGGG